MNSDKDNEKQAKNNQPENKSVHANQEDEVVYDDEKKGNTLNDYQDLTNKLNKLKNDLKQCRTEKMEYLSNWQKSQAELINYRKRQEKRIGEIYQTAGAEIIKELLPVLDSLEEAIKHQNSDNQPREDIQRGLKSLLEQILTIFHRHGLESITPVGQEFDPNLCEAVDVVDCLKEQDGQVVEVIQSGYTLNGQLLRSAKVRVGRSKNK